MTGAPVRSSQNAGRSTAGSVAANAWQARTLVFGGSCCVLLGGAVAAVTGPLGLAKGSWLAAYLVLVCGVGTRSMGVMQSRSPGGPMPAGRGWTQLASWLVGNAAVIAGSLLGVAGIVDAGALLLVVAVVMALIDTTRPTPLAAPGSSRWVMAWGYRCLLVLLIISIPIGSILAHLRDIS
ncbi:MAG: hypothetical protein ABJD68_00830 [Nakamurella sp.]